MADETLEQLLNRIPDDRHFILSTQMQEPDGEGNKVEGYMFQIRKPLVYGTQLLHDAFGKTPAEAIRGALEKAGY